jgi:ATP-dependent helicase/nuclease subunit A
MRDRIRRRCQQRLAAAPARHFDYWRRLVWQLDAARVSTIHSFCATLLRWHAAPVGLDPRFETLEPAAARTLAAALVDDHLRASLGAGEENVVGLVRQLRLKDVQARLLALVTSRDRDAIESFLRRTPEDLIALWNDRIAAIAGVLAANVSSSATARRVLDVIEQHGGGFKHPTIRERCEALRKLLPRLGQSKAVAADLIAVKEATEVKGFHHAKNWADPDVYPQYRDCVQALRKQVQKAIDAVDVDGAATRMAAELGLSLVREAAAVLRALEEEKRVKGLLDFDDLLVYAARLLQADESADLRRRLAGTIRLLLVDESQDTDPSQVALIRALCDGDVSGGKLFYVGDYKQSIYRFRGADPQVFRELAGSLPAAGRLPLTENFRSQPAVLRFVNALFEREFEAYEPLVAHRDQVASPPSVELLFGEMQRERREEGDSERLREQEASWIARRLAAMFDGQEPLVVDGEGKPRAVRPGDAAILFRALSNIDLYETALRQAGIDYYLVGGHAFYSQQEIFDLVNLLRSVLSPADALSLAGVLRSPMFGLADEALFWLGQARGGLAAGLFAEKLPEALDGRERAAAHRAARTLTELRFLKDRLSITELIQRALALTGYDATLLGEFLGERKLANLRKLIDQARSFDRSGLFTLADFVAQLADFVANQPDEALAATQGETGNVVRLMTIHQAKGLEFPVVVVADVDRKPAHQNPPVCLDRNWGPLAALPAKSPDGRTNTKGTTPYDTYKRLRAEEEEEESVRLFYVATTRAADHLILSGQRFAGEGPQNRWTQLLEDRPSAIAPHVRVVGEPPPLASTRRGPRRPDLLQVVEEARAEAGNVWAAVPTCSRPVAPAASRLPIYSFSRLSGQLALVEQDDMALGVIEPTGEEPIRPGSRDEALALGDLVHRAIAHLRLGESVDVPQLVARHAEQLLIDDADVRATAGKLVAALIASPVAKQLKEARRVHNEIEFLLAWPPGDMSSKALLHGVIDCLYQDAAGDWHVADYKTNRLDAPGGEDSVVAHYRPQVLLYALAAEKSLGVAPRTVTLHFLRGGRQHCEPYTDEARRWIVDYIDRALDAANLASSEATR